MTSLVQCRKQTFLSELSTLRYNAAKAAERKRQAEKSGNKPTQEETDEEKKTPWFKDYGEVICRYLQQVHSIKTIKEFASKVNYANYNRDIAEQDLKISFRTLDSIISACEKWKDYLEDEEAFNCLVCIEVISMVKIHASVIAARNFQDRQGAAGVRLKSDACIPQLFTTVVSYHGMVRVFS